MSLRTLPSRHACDSVVVVTAPLCPPTCPCLWDARPCLLGSHCHHGLLYPIFRPYQPALLAPLLLTYLHLGLSRGPLSPTKWNNDKGGKKGAQRQRIPPEVRVPSFCADWLGPKRRHVPRRCSSFHPCLLHSPAWPKVTHMSLGGTVSSTKERPGFSETFRIL